MRQTAQALAEHVSQYSAVLLPVGLLLTTCSSEIITPIPHSLLTSSFAWGLLWICSAVRVGISAGLHNTHRKRLSWSAGFLLALAQICARGALDKEVLWWTKALLPAFVWIILESAILVKTESTSPDNPPSLDTAPSSGSYRLLAIITLSAGFALSCSFVTPQNLTLGLSSVIFFACGIIVLEQAILCTKDDKLSGSRGFMLANGSFSRRNSSASSQQENPGTCLRDLAAVTAITCGLFALLSESFRVDQLTFDRHVEMLGGEWRFAQNLWLKIRVLLAILLNMMQSALVFAVINQRTAFFTSIILLSASLIAQALINFSLWSSWFTILYLLALAAFAEESGVALQASLTRARRRLRNLIVLMGAASLLFFASRIFSNPISFQYHPSPQSLFNGQSKQFEPLQLASTKLHPVKQLTDAAEKEFSRRLESQSKTLQDAVNEYRRRYKLQPPPHFDIWFEFAKRKGVQLIDEFDTVHEALLPFWGLDPATIRSRAREAIGNEENMMIALLIRDGSAVKIERGAEWQQQATLGMIKDFVQYLPDMDLAFNIHDEPRVVIPHDRLSILVSRALDDRIPKAFANEHPKNSFSARPPDMTNGKRIEEVTTTRFNKFAHQGTWSHSRMSCAADSPARAYEEIPTDNLTSYAAGSLGFVYNLTAFMDICMSPSLSQSYGFFDRPNAYNLVSELFPIFSQSKIGSYQDIIYPSPWYWAHKVVYEEHRDLDWDQKISSLYWRGSTTGGFSKRGGWRHQHRQHVVQKLNAHDSANILTNVGAEQSPDWQSKEIKRSELKDLIDVKFSHVGQCEEADCNAQRDFFDVTDRVDPGDAWKWKHLLDIDGNAFSGRFYSFLQSKSAVFKMAVFQEWHKEWVVPWVHYVPFSLRGDEWLETMRYFSHEQEGKSHAQKMAADSRDWAYKALRDEDFEVWFFRLLLEYGRIIDDNRETIGYPGP